MSKYIKKETKGQIIFVVMIILAIAIGLLWNALEEKNSVPTWEPEGAYPMANANISWEQTHYAGGWGENNGGT